jgi:hypothetical protein
MATHHDKRIVRQGKVKVGILTPKRTKKQPGPVPKSWRGKAAKPKYGLSTVPIYKDGVFQQHSSSYTAEEWARRKAARKRRQAAQRRNRT